MSVSFKLWDQRPGTEKSTKDIIKMYEGGYAAALYSEEENERLIAECGGKFGEDITHTMGFADSGKGKLVIPFTHVMDKYPLAWPGKGQTIGSCVQNSMINAELGTMVLESVLGKPDEKTGKIEGCPKVSKAAEKSTVLAFEPGYWFRESSGDGWFCSASCRIAVTKCGAIVRKDYPELGVNLENYSAKNAHKYGRTPPDQSVIDKLNNNLFRQATEIKTFEAIRDFLNRGFFITSCGSEGFSNKRDEFGVSKRKGSWAHAICVISADDRPEIHAKYGEPLVLMLNSWAQFNSGPRIIMGTNIRIPHGSFWARWSDVKNRYFAAMSGLHGWERENLPDLDPNGLPEWSPSAI